MTDVAAVVAAASTSRGIGKDGTLPWKLPGDMAHFKRLTSTPPSPGLVNAVIMGRKTWESIPPKFRPLGGRTNVVLTRRKTLHDGDDGRDNSLSAIHDESVILASSLQDATLQLKMKANLGNVFVIGGEQVYEESIKSGLVQRVYYTEILNLDKDAEFDAWFPELAPDEWECHPYVSSDLEKNTHHKDEKSGLEYRFLQYQRRTGRDHLSEGEEKKQDYDEGECRIEEGAHVNPEEMQYLDLCRDILQNGVKRGDRTGTGTLSKFGTQMRFSLREGTMPLLTTKRTFWRGLAEELLWFIEGNTNANDLAAKNVHIWDGNGSRDFLDRRGLSHREIGDLGPVYGFQWRHFGAKYIDMHTDYAGQGVDQLAECIHKIKNNPEDRRIIMSAWNPSDLDAMALPPCHMFCQFYVDTTRNELSCQMYQRSADMGLGVPFNIASYALLTHMVAHVTGLKPGDFVHTIGDAHIYLNHVEALEEQMKRFPRAFPKLKINQKKADIDDFVFDDFELLDYNPHKTIKMKMAV